MTDHTHRVVGKEHRRSAAHSAVDSDASDGPAVTYEPGDPITPTDAELRSMPFRFEPIEQESADEPESEAPEGSEGDDETDAESGQSDADDAADDVDSPSFTKDDLDDKSYSELRTLAAHFEDINGNSSEERLRIELADKAEG